MVSQVGKLIPGKAAYINAVKLILPSGRDIKAADDVHKGRLPGSAFTHNGHEIILYNVGIDPPECMNLNISHFVNFYQIFN